MSLAAALLEAGRVDAVRQYFDLCEVFWTYKAGRELLHTWREDLVNGRPPDFGPNMIY
jgi:hypothetical protein